MIIGDPGVGKTTIILDMIANIGIAYPQLKILFVSAEMNQIDLAVYVQTFPKFGDIDILFIDSNFEEETHNWETMRDALSEGWDIVDVDSFYELQGIIKEEESITLKKAESLLLSLIKKHNLGSNKLKKIRRSLQYNK